MEESAIFHRHSNLLEAVCCIITLTVGNASGLGCFSPFRYTLQHKQKGHAKIGSLSYINWS